MNFVKKSSALDLIPTPLVVKCIDVLLPVITKEVNISLVIFPQHGKGLWFDRFLRRTVLTLFLKNYRPVSNLSFISKVTERAVFLKIDWHMRKRDLNPPRQSACRRKYSAETALLKVTNDILMEMNS